jgi:hypothetical protein
MPVGGDVEALRPRIVELQRAFADAGKPPAEVVVLTTLPLADRQRTAEQLAQLADAGATRVVHAWRYADAAAFAQAAESLRRALPRTTPT